MRGEMEFDECDDLNEIVERGWESHMNVEKKTICESVEQIQSANAEFLKLMKNLCRQIKKGARGDTVVKWQHELENLVLTSHGFAADTDEIAVQHSASVLGTMIKGVTKRCLPLFSNFLQRDVCRTETSETVGCGS